MKINLIEEKTPRNTYGQIEVGEYFVFNNPTNARLAGILFKTSLTSYLAIGEKSVIHYPTPKADSFAVPITIESIDIKRKD